MNKPGGAAVKNIGIDIANTFGSEISVNRYQQRRYRPSSSQNSKVNVRSSVLSRVIERLVVKQFVYPALLTPPLVFGDQFAFSPTGYCCCIAILQIITSLLSGHPYVIVISLDFSEAFDTVRHATLIQKFAQLDIPDDVYNWLADYFTAALVTIVQCNTLVARYSRQLIGPADWVFVTLGPLRCD